jgi:hypothetical protein
MKYLILMMLTTLTTTAFARDYQCSVSEYTTFEQGIVSKIRFDDVLVKEIRSAPGLIAFIYDTRTLIFKVRHSHPDAVTVIQLAVENRIDNESINLELTPGHAAEATSPSGDTRVEAYCREVKIK